MTEIPNDPDWMPFYTEPEEPKVFALGKRLYEVIAESEDGWFILMPLNMVIIDKAGDDVIELKKQHRGE